MASRVIVGSSLLRRVERDTLIVCGALALAALAIWPARPLIAGGVVGGGVLIGGAYVAIKGFVGQFSRPAGRGWHLVKFFTRHAILAFAAYVMMARLRLDPVGMLVGASSLVAAVVLEAARTARSGHTASGR